MVTWKHTTKYKGQIFIAGYEMFNGKRVMKFKNKRTGRELPFKFGNAQQANMAGWVKV